MQKAKKQPLGRQFFRQQVVVLAKALIGKILVSDIDGKIVRCRIVQAQAYKAPLDRACHAFGGKKTDRTKYFWLDGGHFYIYTIYSPKNVCLNITAGLLDQPEAVLIRAVQPIQGLEIIKTRRQIASEKIEELCNGPGKVGQAMGIDKDKLNGLDLTIGKICWVEDDPQFKGRIGISPRINIDYAQEWIDKPWRFFVEDNKFVSKVPVKKDKKQLNIKGKVHQKNKQHSKQKPQIKK